MRPRLIDAIIMKLPADCRAGAPAETSAEEGMMAADEGTAASRERHDQGQPRTIRCGEDRPKDRPNWSIETNMLLAFNLFCAFKDWPNFAIYDQPTTYLNKRATSLLI